MRNRNGGGTMRGKKALCGILALVCVLSLFLGCTQGSDSGDTETGEKTSVERELVFGLGEPLVSSNVKNFNLEKTIQLIGAIGAKSYRMWFTPTDVFSDWSWTEVSSDASLSSLPKNTIAKYNDIFAQLEDAGVKEITGMGNFFPVTPSTRTGTGKLVPEYGTNDYQQFLDQIEIIWKTMASSFPQITHWEVGNETNHTAFVQRADNANMSYSELLAVTTDLMYYARRGVLAGNPDAVVITPGFAPVTSYYDDNGKSVPLKNGIQAVKLAMEGIYENISGGKFPYGEDPDTDPDNYFDGVAWHPYDLGTVGYANTNDPSVQTFDIDLWVDANNAVYEVMKENGDGDKEVWFTEFGLSTKAANLTETVADDTDILRYCVDNKYYKTTEAYEEQQAEFVQEYFNAMLSDEMHYVHACHFFRLYGCTTDYSWNGFTVLYYGIFLEPDETLNRGYYPRSKAYTLQRIYGGTGDLAKYAEWGSI